MTDVDAFEKTEIAIGYLYLIVALTIFVLLIAAWVVGMQSKLPPGGDKGTLAGAIVATLLIMGIIGALVSDGAPEAFPDEIDANQSKQFDDASAYFYMIIAFFILVMFIWALYTARGMLVQKSGKVSQAGAVFGSLLAAILILGIIGILVSKAALVFEIFGISASEDSKCTIPASRVPENGCLPGEYCDINSTCRNCKSDADQCESTYECCNGLVCKSSGQTPGKHICQ